MELTLYQADFAVTLANVAAAGGADLILTSPPYPGIARTYGQAPDAALWTLPDYQRLGDAVKPALKPGAHCLMVLDAPVREWRPGYGTERGFMPWIVMLDWAERVGLRVPDRLAYGRQGVPGEYRGRFRNDWEPLLWFQAHGDGYFDKWQIATDAVESQARERKSDWRRDGSVYERKPSGRAVEEGKAHRGTHWFYATVGGTDQDGEAAEHTARFPPCLAEDAVRCFCPPDGIVCDPFVGSGTSAVAAIRHGRRFMGGDLLARPADGMPWIEVTRRRVERDGPVAPQKADDGPLFGGAA